MKRLRMATARYLIRRRRNNRWNYYHNFPEHEKAYLSQTKPTPESFAEAPTLSSAQLKEVKS